MSLNIILLGCGARGQLFADILTANPHLGRIVAIADPIPDRRTKVGNQHNVPNENRFNTWQDLFTKEMENGKHA